MFCLLYFLILTSRNTVTFFALLVLIVPANEELNLLFLITNFLQSTSYLSNLIIYKSV